MQEVIQPPSLSNTLECATEENDLGQTENEPLIPGLDNTHAEVDYNAMDNLTLLATLNIQDKTETGENLLPDLEQ